MKPTPWQALVADLAGTATRNQRMSGLSPGARAMVELSEHNRLVLRDALRADGAATVRHLTEATGLSRETVAKHLRAMVADGEARITDDNLWALW